MACSTPVLTTWPVLVGLTIIPPKSLKAQRILAGSFVISVRGIVRPWRAARSSWYGLYSACQMFAGWLIHRVSRARILPTNAARVSWRQKVAIPSSIPSGVPGVRNLRYQMLVGVGSGCPLHHNHGSSFAPGRCVSVC